DAMHPRPLPRLLGGREDREHRERPVDALRRGPVGEAASRPVRRLRPNDRATVAARDDEQPLADRRGAVVGRPELPPLDLIPMPLERADPLPERPTLPAGAGAQPIRRTNERSPIGEFLDVLEDNDPWAHGPCPPRHDPRKRSGAPRSIAQRL